MAFSRFGSVKLDTLLTGPACPNFQLEGVPFSLLEGLI
ncbi:hypothetical protein SAMN05421755_10936 [Nitrosomonas sp. Nm33]|nr:hypothetical protein SAMN05421755_10936 [Nitrosomonas sp. Nm33]